MNTKAKIISSLLLFLSCTAFAYAQNALEHFDNEPPIVRELLVQASDLLTSENDDANWQAANKLCEASRYGSAEAIYQLGVLYALGRGVPASREYAANLFGIAATNGHFEAQKMLETLEITSQATPFCIYENVPPEKIPEKQPEDESATYASPAIDKYIASLPKSKRQLVELATEIAEKHEVDPKLVLSIITAESNFTVSAKSNADAHGLMQLIPATAERFNVKNIYNASQNIKGGVKYLRWLLSYFRGDVALSVAAYNAGERAVDKYFGVPPYKETQAYVKKVLELYQKGRHQFDARLTNPSPALNPPKRTLKKVKRKAEL